MRKRIIAKVMARAFALSAVCLAVPSVVAIGYQEHSWKAFCGTTLVCILVSLFIARQKSIRTHTLHGLRRREGFVAVVVVWMIVVLTTALAYWLSGSFVGFAEAFFESMSGYTTTGATIAPDIEALPFSILFMRSFSHWMGGMGIIVLSIAILPELAVGGMQLFAAESTGIGTDKLAPRIASTARRLWFLYVAITLLEAVLLYLGPMNAFDAINHSMATIATGGFSTKNGSIADFHSLYVEMVILAFMFLSGINFTLQFRALVLRKPGALLRSQETRLYIVLALCSIAVVALSIYGTQAKYTGIGTTLRDASFTTVSIMTTTGFGTADFETWPAFSQLLLVLLMLIGGCAGSTSGGTKVVRLYVLFQHARLQLRKLIRPRLVQSIRVGNMPVTRDTTEGIIGYYLFYFIALMGGSLALTAFGLSIVSGTTGALSALNSIGPGLDAFGPTDNFASVPDGGLYLMSFGMLLGRLEILPLLVLFSRHFWRQG